MPNKSRNKGNRFERQVVNTALSLGLKSYRYYGSRSPQNDAWDVMVAGRNYQCKIEASGFKRIRSWLTPGVDGLIIGSDYDPPLVVVPLSDYLKLL